MKDLAVIIVSFNTRELLRACLQTLKTSLDRCHVGSDQPGESADVPDATGASGPRSVAWGLAPRSAPSGAQAPALPDPFRPPLTYEVFVVDNGSTDDSPAMVSGGFPWVRLLDLGENRGFAAANNLAIREADARYFLFLNPDTEVLGDAPAALVRFLEGHPQVAVAGGRLLNADLSFQHSCFKFPTLLMSFLDFFPLNRRLTDSRLNGRYPREWYARAFPIDHPLGACMIVRAEIVQRLGAFDEGYFMYAEEVDWCYRIKQDGWVISYTPDAEVIHHVGQSTRQNAGPMLVQLHRSRDRFFRKHYGAAFAWLARRIVRLGMAAATRESEREARAGAIDGAELARRRAVYRDASAR